MKREEEVQKKLELVREVLKRKNLAAAAFGRTEWFNWLTGGASHTVLLAAETGVADVLISKDAAYIITDEIEYERLAQEEIPPGFSYLVFPWAEKKKRLAMIREATGGSAIMADSGFDWGESERIPVDQELLEARYCLFPSERERYQKVGHLAAAAMKEALSGARPDMTEYELAGRGAEALYRKGLDPALILVAGERRLPVHRHPTPTHEKIGRRAMMVFCARGYGLYANLTRFVYFGNPKKEEIIAHEDLQEIESKILNNCRDGVRLSEFYSLIDKAYQERGYHSAMKEHHQGGTTGYLSRELVMRPEINLVLRNSMAVAFNPSVRGAKIEDTFYVGENGELENLTYDAAWPSVLVHGRARPLPLVL